MAFSRPQLGPQPIYQPGMALRIQVIPCSGPSVNHPTLPNSTHVLNLMFKEVSEPLKCGGGNHHIHVHLIHQTKSP